MFSDCMLYIFIIVQLIPQGANYKTKSKATKCLPAWISAAEQNGMKHGEHSQKSELRCIIVVKKCINKHDYLLYLVSGKNLRLTFVLITSMQVNSDKNLLTIASKESKTKLIQLRHI